MVTLVGYVSPDIPNWETALRAERLNVWMRDIKLIGEYTGALSPRNVAVGAAPDTGIGELLLPSQSILVGGSTALGVLSGATDTYLMSTGTSVKFATAAEVAFRNWLVHPYLT